MIGADAFGECPLNNLALPVALTTIGHRAFDGCTCIVELNLPATITFVGHGAFRGCTALAKVFLPANLTTEFIIVGEGAFTGCSALSPEAYEVIRALRTPALRSPRPLMRYGAISYGLSQGHSTISTSFPLSSPVFWFALCSSLGLIAFTEIYGVSL